MNVPALTDTLGLLARAVGVGTFLSFLFETAPGISKWFQALNTSLKWWIIFLLSVLLPIGAQLVIQFVPPEVLASLEPYWMAAAFGFLAWSGSQGTHILFNKKLNGK